MATTIEPLTLTQDRIDLPFGRVTRPWYGWITTWGTAWSDRPVSRRYGGEPDYTCEVTHPAILVGSNEDALSDIGWALFHHADRLGLN